MHDVIVIGGRCAGAATAMLLARAGLRVLLVDRARFPSDIPHGHFIHRQGPERLQRWGVLDRIVATGAPPVTSWTLDEGDFPLRGENLTANSVAFGYAPRRVALDAVMIEAAAEAGAEVREGFVFEDVVRDGDAVTGIRGRQLGGTASITERARCVVGADGRNSRLARQVQAQAYDVVPALTCWYFSYWSGLPDAGLEVYARERNVFFSFPTNDQLVALFVAWPREEFPRIRADIESHFIAAVDQIPELAARIRDGHREEPFRGMADLPNFYRKPYGAGWALVGDAGCHKDPYLALGICDALRDAELLADALVAGLSGPAPLQNALATFESARNAASRDDYQRNLDRARFRPIPPELARLRASVRGDSAATTRLLMALQGRVPMETALRPSA